MSDTPWKGKKVLVTGASMGIGEQIARRFAARGADLILVARSAGRLKALQEELRALGVSCDILPADLARPADVRALGQEIRARGRLDVLVHNAGAILYEHFLSGREEDFRSLFELNFFSVLSLTREAMPALEASARAGGGPRLVLISSIAAWRALPLWSAYCSSKAALSSWAEAVRMELKPKGIGVTTVCPGVTKTNLSANAASQGPKPFATTEGKGVPPETVAAAVVRACEKGKRDESVILFNRFYRWLTFLCPRLFDAYFEKYYRKRGWL